MRTPDTGAIILPSSPPDIFAVSRPSYVTRDIQHSLHLLLVSTGSPFIIPDSGRVEAGHYPPPVSRGTHDTSHKESGLATANVSRRRGRVLPVTGPVAASCHSAGITALKETRPILSVNPRLGGNV